MTGKFFEKIKRAIVAILVVTMIMTSVGEYVPMWSVASAEGETADLSAPEQTSPGEASMPLEAEESTPAEEESDPEPAAEALADEVKPTEEPTEAPAEEPTEAPAEEPTEAPAEEPTEAPAEEPTEVPSEEPTEAPAEEPTEAPAEEPTEAPVEESTEAPTEESTEAPAEEPTEAPTEEPTETPAEEPTEAPAEGENAEAGLSEDAPEAEGVSDDAEGEEISDETEEPAAAEPTGMESLLAVPVLSAAAPVTEPAMLSAAADDKEEDEGKISELQDMINKQMAALASLSGRLQIVLEKKYTYDGDITITAQEREVADDFVLEIAADGAGDGHEGGGYTIVNGNLTIKGIAVEMKSVMMAEESKISVLNDSEFASDRGASLLYMSTQNLNTKLSVEVGKLSSADIRMTGKDDGLDLWVLKDAGKVDVDMGEGLNDVNAVLYGGDVTIRTGDGSDTLSVNVQEGTQSVDVTTGADYDELTLIVDGDPSSLTADTGASDDKITIDVRANAGDIYVNTGVGADTVTVSKGDHHTMENVNYTANVNPTEVINDSTTAVLTIENADETAIDRVAIDAAVSDALKGVVILGENGSAVHFKGTLQSSGGNEDYNPMGWLSEDSFYLTGEHGNRLEISGSAKNSYTDALTNKRTVELSASGSSYTYDAAKNGALDDFTDYAFITPVSGLTDITFTPTRPLTLSNVLLDTERSLDEEDHLAVNNLSAWNMNVLLKGQKIDINGTVEGRNVRAQSVQGTTTIQQAFNEQFSAGTFMASMYHSDTNAETPMDLINVFHEAEININAGAKIHAAETVALEARVKQVGAMSVLIPDGVNFLNWKQGNARINIDGEIVTDHGSVTAETKIQTTAGYRIMPAEDGSMGIMQSGMPIAVSVVLNKSSVIMNEKAKIRSGSDIVLDARSEIKVSTYADNGTIPAPFAVAFTWIDNQVRSKVYGRIDAGRRLLARSTGSVENVTKAIRSSVNASPSSFYGAVNIVDQDVESIIGGSARVVTGGDVSVYSDAYADIDTTAKSTSDHQDEGSPTTEAIMTLIKSLMSSVADYLGPQLMDSYAIETLREKLEKIGEVSYSAKVINAGEHSDKGSATLVTSKRDGIVKVGVNVNTEAGWGVKDVYYRYLEPGKTGYTWKKVEQDAAGAYTFLMEDANIEVVVNYEEGAQVPAQVQADGGNMNVNEIVNEAAEGGDDVDAEGELSTLKPIAEGGPAYSLIYETMTDGNVVTWLEPTHGERLSRVAPGQKILFVPNPDPGKQLKSLVLHFTKEVDGVNLIKSEIVAPDSKGRYIFNAPDDLGNGAILEVSATFEDKQETKDEAHSQFAGAVAVSIVNSDDVSRIEDGAQVVTGGSVDMFNFRIASVSTVADGTEVGPITPSSANDNLGKPQPTTKTKFSVSGAQYALRINSAQGGTVSYDEGVEAYHPKFSITPAEGYYIEKAYVSYYTKYNTSFTNGKRCTANLHYMGNGVYEADLMTMPVVDGSTADITVVFAKIENAERYDDDVRTEMTYVVRNPICISYNALVEKNINNQQTITEIGTVNYVPILSGDGKYYVTLHPDEEHGYIIDALDEDDTTQTNSDKGQLFASYIDGAGVTRKIGLKRDANGWYLTLSGKGVPAGALVTINAVFTEDLHELKAAKEEVDGHEVDHGTVAFSKEKAKATDKVTITAKPNDGYRATKVTVKWVETNYGLPKPQTQEYTLNDKGQVEITMPQIAAEGSLTVTPKFEEKTVTLNATGSVDGNASDENVTLSETGKGYKTQKIIVSPSEDLAKEGYKVSSITLHYYDANHEEKNVTLENPGYEMSFNIPESIASMGSQGETIEITATLEKKSIPLSTHADENGKIVPACAFAEPGETVKVKIEAEDGYRIKAGTLKAEITTAGSSYQILVKKDSSGNYSFVMPGSADIDQHTTVNFVGEFEPGSDGVERTIGTAIAVSVVGADNNVEIGDASIVAAEGVSMIAISVASSVSTESKSGYTEGDVGFAGALTVQVANSDVRTIIRKNRTGGISLGDGYLFMLSKGRQSFEAVADASGDPKKEDAERTGVGVGVAVAVNTVDNIVEVEDGVKLGRVFVDKNGALRYADAGLHSVYIESTQWTTDIVTAKAGVAGGSAWVPAAAVDVTILKSKAKLGRMSAATLDMTDDVTIKAESTASTSSPTIHTISADAAARGGGAAIGAALAVDYIKNTVEALLNQSMTAPSVTIKATAGDTLKSTAKAAVSGGKASKKEEDGKGSADKQADKLLGSASGIAAKSGAKAVPSSEVNQSANERQKAETTEQSVAGAGALVLNIQKNESRAEVNDNVNLFVSGTLSVHSSNRTTAEIKADSSATKADTGVGVGVALNIVDIKNIARIGNGIVTAGNLEVIADIADMPKSTITYLQVRDIGGFAFEIKSMIDKAISDWLKETGLDKEWAESLASVVGTLVGEFVSELLRDTEIRSLLDVAADGGIMGNFESFYNNYKDRLMNDLPTMMLQPFTNLYKEVSIMANMTEEEYLQLIRDIGMEVTYQFGGIAVESSKSFVKNAAGGLISVALNAVSARLTGNGFDKSNIKDALKNSLKTELIKMGEAMLADAVAKLATRLPVLTEDNIQYITKLVKGGTDKLLQNTAGDYLDYISSAFREKIFDYEKYITMYAEGDIWDGLKTRLIDAIKHAQVTATNEAIDMLTGKFGLKLEKPSKDDKHVLTTQAISGAGGKNKSGAGSLAITVLNEVTRAELADSENAVTVLNDGMLTVKAQEERRVRNVASAAVDAMGNADENDGVGNTDKAGTGTGADAEKQMKKDKLVVLSKPGANLSFDASKPDKEPRVWITLEEGYKIPENGTVTRIYKREDGEEVDDSNVEIHQAEDGRYYFDPFEANDADYLFANDVTIKVEFEENLIYRIPSDALMVMAEDDPPIPEGTVSVSVKDRVVEDDALVTRAGDMVQVVAKPLEGYHPTGIAYEYEDENGERKSVESRIIASSNEVEAVFVFKMPEGNVTGILVQYEKGEAENKDGAGRKIGVGASFALTYGKSTVEAKIGQRGTAGRYGSDEEADPDDNYGVVAGTVSVTANSKHQEYNNAVAGSDPLEGTNNDLEKDVGFDASISINILDNDIRASVAEGTAIRTTAAPVRPVAEEEDDGEETDDEEEYTAQDEIQQDESEKALKDMSVLGSVTVSASEESKNETLASAYATGSTTAIGASVAVNVSLSDIKTIVNAPIDASGAVHVTANSKSEDNTWSFASAMGADVQRALNKFAKGVNATEEKANQLTKGELFDTKDKKSNNTSKKFSDRLNANQQDGADAADPNLPASTNVLRSQAVNVGDADDQEAQDDANENVNRDGENNPGNQNLQNKKTKWQIAAAVGFTWAQHDAAVTVNGTIDAGTGIEVTSGNHGNFVTRSTGVSMTAESVEGKGSARSIAAAVAVSVDKNKATVDMKGDVITNEGDVVISSDLTQNMDEGYTGKIAAQALSLTLSGKGTGVSIAASIGLAVSFADSTVNVGPTTEDGEWSIKGDAVHISATDKSRLGVRAGGVNLARGSSVGAGVSAASIWSGDNVKAIVADNVRIDADSFNLIARKSGVTRDDFKYSFTWRDLVTDSSSYSDEDRENSHTGLIDVHRKPGETSYTVDLNVNTYNVMKAIDVLNYFTGVNYYTEAITGSVMTGGEDNKFNLAGTLSVVRAHNNIDAILGKNARVNLTGAMNVDAESGSNARLIAGDIAAGKVSSSWGVTGTFYKNADQVKAETGEGADIASGSFRQNATANADVQNYNAAASVALGDTANLAVGGTVNIILMKSVARNNVGENAVVDAKGAFDLTAGSDMNLVMLSAGIAGTGRATAVGGTVAIVDNKAEATVSVGNNHAFAADGDMTISAKAVDHATSIIASASAALSKDGTSFAGALNVVIEKAKGNVTLGTGSNFTTRRGDETIEHVSGLVSRSGSVALKGEADSHVVNATLAVGVSQNTAIGLSINGSFFDRESKVTVNGGEDYVINAAKDVLVSTKGVDTFATVGAALAGSVTEGGYAGNLMFVKSDSIFATKVLAGTVTAGNDATFASHLEDHTYAIGGGLTFSVAKSSLGGAAVALVKDNEVITDVGASRINAGTGAGNSASEGVYVGATVKDTLITGSAGIAYGTEKGVTVNLLGMYNRNTIKATAENARIHAVRGGAKVEAAADTVERLISGGLNAGLSRSGGGAAVGLYHEKNVDAVAGEITAAGDIAVKADNNDDSLMLAIAAGVSMDFTGEVGIAVQVLKNKVHARAANHLNSAAGDIEIKSVNTTELDNAAVTVAGSFGYAVAPSFVVTWFEGETTAKAEKDVKAAKGVTIHADGGKEIDQRTIGAAITPEMFTLPISGAVTVLVAKDKIAATAGESTDVRAAQGDIDIIAEGKLDTMTLSAAISGGGLSKAVNAAIGIVKDDVQAKLAGNATASKDVNVKATAERDVVDISGTVDVGVGNVVGATVLGVFVGAEKISQDAADSLVYGNSEDEDDQQVFNAQGALDMVTEKGLDATPISSLTVELEGDDINDSENTPVSLDQATNVIDVISSTASLISQSNDEENQEENRPKTTPKDVIMASIADTAVITSGGNVNVTAEQPTKADVYGGGVEAATTTYAIGGTATFVVMHSNVLATSQGTLSLQGGDVNVNASSTAGNESVNDDAGEAARQQMLTDNAGDALLEGLNPFNRSIRAVSLNAAGTSAVGVGASVAVVRADNVTSAVLGGRVNEVGKVDVHADSLYDDILAATLSLGGGSVGLSAGVAVAASDGEVSARVDGNLRLLNETAATPTIGVTTDSIFRVNSAAASIATGAGALNVGVSYAKNNLTQTTSIDRGAKIITNGGAATINVAALSNSHANAFLLPVQGGAVSGGLSAGIANVKPTIRTGIGTLGNEVGKTVITAEDADVTVRNLIMSDQKSGSLSLGLGYYAALGGLAMISDNTTDAVARIANTELKANRLTVSSAVNAIGDSTVLNASGALVGLAFANNTVDVNATNLAAIDTDNGTIITNQGVDVNTGDEDSSYTRATADGASLIVGALANGRINANATNRTSNTASVTGRGRIDAGEGALNVSAYSKAEATSDVGGAQITGISIEIGDEILAPLAKATNNATSHAIVKLGEALDSDLNVASTMDAKTTAEMTNDGIQLISFEGAEAKAYGKANSLIDVELAKASLKKVGVSAVNSGKDEVSAENGKTIFAAAALTALDAIAESEDVFSTNVKLSPDEYRLSSLNVTTDYSVDTTARTRPSALGVGVNLLEGELNNAEATNTAHANARLVLTGGKVSVDKGVSVQTTGSATATAEGILPIFKLTSVSITGSDATAELTAKQAAELELNDSELISYGRVDVSSLVNKASALASVGANGIEDPENAGFDVNIGIKAKYNSARAEEKMSSTAIVYGSGAQNSTVRASGLNIASGVADDAKTEASATSTANGEFTLASSFGDLSASSTVADKFHTVLDNVSANIIGKTSITATGEAESNGLAHAAPAVAILSNFTRSDVDAHVGIDHEAQTVRVTIGDNVRMKSAGALEIAAKNNGLADAHYSGKGFTLIAHNVTGEQKTSSWYDTGVTIGQNANLTALGGANIIADSMTRSKSDIHSEDAAFLINASSMYGDSDVNSENDVEIGKGTVINAVGDLNIQASSSTESRSVSKYENYFSFRSQYGDDEEIATAKNHVNRNQRVFVDDNVQLNSSGGAVRLASVSGQKDNIYTYAFGNEIGFDGDAQSLAELTLISSDRVILQQGVKVTAAKDIDITALSTSYNPSDDERFGSRTEAVVKGGGAIADPDAKSKAYVYHYAQVDINKGWNGARTTLESKYGDINVNTSNEGMRVYVRTNADNNGGTGESNARSELHAILVNGIWVDNTSMSANKTTMKAFNDAYAHVYSHAELYGIIAGTYAKSYMYGSQNNYLQSHRAANVNVTGAFEHQALKPGKNLSFAYYLETRRSGLIQVGNEKTSDDSQIKNHDDFQSQTSYEKDEFEKPGGFQATNLSYAATVLANSLEQATTTLSDISEAVDTARAENLEKVDALLEAVYEILNSDIRESI